jgi:hypothetical protein
VTVFSYKLTHSKRGTILAPNWFRIVSFPAYGSTGAL